MTHHPARLGEVLLELLGDGGVDVPLGLLARDPTVLQGGAGKVYKCRGKLETREGGAVSGKLFC